MLGAGRSAMLRDFSGVKCGTGDWYSSQASLQKSDRIPILPKLKRVS